MTNRETNKVLDRKQEIEEKKYCNISTKHFIKIIEKTHEGYDHKALNPE